MNVISNACESVKGVFISPSPTPNSWFNRAVMPASPGDPLQFSELCNKITLAVVFAGIIFVLGSIPAAAVSFHALNASMIVNFLVSHTLGTLVGAVLSATAAHFVFLAAYSTLPMDRLTTAGKVAAYAILTIAGIGCTFAAGDLLSKCLSKSLIAIHQPLHQKEIQEILAAPIPSTNDFSTNDVVHVALNGLKKGFSELAVSSAWSIYSIGKGVADGFVFGITAQMTMNSTSASYLAIDAAAAQDVN